MASLEDRQPLDRAKSRALAMAWSREAFELAERKKKERGDTSLDDRQPLDRARSRALALEWYRGVFELAERKKKEH